MDKFTVTYTDTFGGEPNYCWVKEKTMVLQPRQGNRWLKRSAKAVMGLSGVRGCWTDFGDMLEFRPYRSCTVMFVRDGGEL